MEETQTTAVTFLPEKEPYATNHAQLTAYLSQWGGFLLQCHMVLCQWYLHHEDKVHAGTITGHHLST